MLCCRPIWLIPALTFLSACTYAPASGNRPEPCSVVWFEGLEDRYHTGDGAGHGPDIGSDEWKSVIEFKLGIREDPNVPGRGTAQWCEFIDDFIGQQNRP